MTDIVAAGAPSLPAADLPSAAVPAAAPPRPERASDAVSGPGRQAGRTQLWLLLAGSCMPVLGAVLIAPVLPQMTDAFAGTPGVSVLVPVVLTVPALLIGLAAPFAGMVVDALDRKRLLVVAMVAYAVFGTAPLYLPTLPMILGSRVLVGVCEAAIITCCTTLIGDYWEGTTRSRYLGMQTLVAALSATVFLGVGGALGSSGWRTPFWLYGVAVLLALPMATKLWLPDRVARAAGRATALPWRALRGPCAVTLGGGIVFYCLIVQLSFVLDDAGVDSTAVIGALSAVMALATAAGAVAFGRLTQLSARRLVPVSFALSAAGLMVVFTTGSMVVIGIGAAITGFGTGLLLPTLLTWAVNRLSFAERGRGTGLWTGTLFIGEFLSPLVVRALDAALGGLRPALGVVGVLSGLAAVITVFTLRTHRGRLDSSNRADAPGVPRS